MPTAAEVICACNADERMTKRARTVIATIAASIENGQTELTQAEIGFRNRKSHRWAQFGVIEGESGGYLRRHRATGANPTRYEIDIPSPEQRQRQLQRQNMPPRRRRRAPDELVEAKLAELTASIEGLRRLIAERLPPSASELRRERDEFARRMREEVSEKR